MITAKKKKIENVWTWCTNPDCGTKYSLTISELKYYEK